MNIITRKIQILINQENVKEVFEKLIFGYRPNDEKHYATNAKYVLIVYDSAGNTITQKGNLNLNHIGY